MATTFIFAGWREGFMFFEPGLLHSAYLSACLSWGHAVRARLRFAPACPVTQSRRPSTPTGAGLNSPNLLFLLCSEWWEGLMFFESGLLHSAYLSARLSWGRAMREFQNRRSLTVYRIMRLLHGATLQG